jgi:endonuclease YncB( thermonuclease family)
MSDKLNPWIYNAEVKKVVDGDTFDIVIDLGFDTLRKGRVRLYGVNTPESRIYRTVACKGSKLG